MISGTIIPREVVQQSILKRLCHLADPETRHFGVQDKVMPMARQHW